MDKQKHEVRAMVDNETVLISIPCGCGCGNRVELCYGLSDILSGEAFDCVPCDLADNGWSVTGKMAKSDDCARELNFDDAA